MQQAKQHVSTAASRHTYTHTHAHARVIPLHQLPSLGNLLTRRIGSRRDMHSINNCSNLRVWTLHYLYATKKYVLIYCITSLQTHPKKEHNLTVSDVPGLRFVTVAYFYCSLDREAPIEGSIISPIWLLKAGECLNCYLTTPQL